MHRKLKKKISLDRPEKVSLLWNYLQCLGSGWEKVCIN